MPPRAKVLRRRGADKTQVSEAAERRRGTQFNSKATDEQKLSPQGVVAVYLQSAPSCSKSQDKKTPNSHQPRRNKSSKDKSKVKENKFLAKIPKKASNMVKTQTMKNRRRTGDVNSISEENQKSTSNRPKRLLINSSVKQGVGEQLSLKSEGTAQQQKRPVRGNTKGKNKKETEDQVYVRLPIKRAQNKQSSQIESREIKDKRREDQKERNRQRLLKETVEQRAKRLKYMRERQKQRIQSESAEERSKRLKKMRTYQAKTGTTEEQLENMRRRQKQRLMAETFEERSRRLGRMRLYQQLKRDKPKRKKASKKTPNKNQSIHTGKKKIAGQSVNMKEQRIHSGSLKDKPQKQEKSNTNQTLEARRHSVADPNKVAIPPDEQFNLDLEDSLDGGSQDDQNASLEHEVSPDFVGYTHFHPESIEANTPDLGTQQSLEKSEI